MLGLTDLLASLMERYGARPALGMRGALQQLCKAALDGLHSRSLSKLASERRLLGFPRVVGSGLAQRRGRAEQQRVAAGQRRVSPPKPASPSFLATTAVAPYTGKAAAPYTGNTVLSQAGFAHSGACTGPGTCGKVSTVGNSPPLWRLAPADHATLQCTLLPPAALLEQEQWQAVQVPAQFQQLAAELEERGALAGAQQPAAPAAEGLSGAQAAAAAEGSGAGSRRGTADSEAPGAASSAAADGGGGDGAGGVPRKFTITPPDGAGPAAQQAQQAPAANGGVAPAGPAPLLVAGGRGYHVVNTQLIVLGMLGEYLAFRDAVPAFAAEVAQRVLELLKVFNSRTCQLVLGAGAMQVRSNRQPQLRRHVACLLCDSPVSLQPLPAAGRVCQHSAPDFMLCRAPAASARRRARATAFECPALTHGQRRSAPGPAGTHPSPCRRSAGAAEQTRPPAAVLSACARCRCRA